MDNKRGRTSRSDDFVLKERIKDYSGDNDDDDDDEDDDVEDTTATSPLNIVKGYSNLNRHCKQIEASLSTKCGPSTWRLTMDLDGPLCFFIKSNSFLSKPNLYLKLDFTN